MALTLLSACATMPSPRVVTGHYLYGFGDEILAPNTQGPDFVLYWATATPEAYSVLHANLPSGVPDARELRLAVVVEGVVTGGTHTASIARGYAELPVFRITRVISAVPDPLPPVA